MGPGTWASAPRKGELCDLPPSRAGERLSTGTPWGGGTAPSSAPGTALDLEVS